MDEDRADVWTVMAIAVIAYATAGILHEGIGHGGACLLTGGKPVLLTSLSFDCSEEGRRVAAGGTTLNLLAGLVCWIGLRVVSRAPRLRYFLWLSMTVNLYQGGGYFLFSGIANIGDWAAIINGLEPAWLWRIGLSVVGAVSYSLFIWISLRELRPFLSQRQPERWQSGRRLMMTPYFAGGVLSCVAGMLNPVGMILVAISAAAATFGGTSALAWTWQFLRRPAADHLVPVRISRSPAWIIAGGILAVLFVVVLGPGIKFR